MLIRIKKYFFAFILLTAIIQFWYIKPSLPSVCGSFTSIDGQKVFFDKILMDYSGRVKLYSSKISNSFDGAYKMIDEKVQIKSRSFVMVFTFIHTDTIIGVSSNVKGKKYVKGKQSAKFCIKNKIAQQKKQIPKMQYKFVDIKETSYIKKQDAKGIEATSFCYACGFFSFIKTIETKNSPYYVSFQLNKDETLFLKSPNLKNAKRGSYYIKENSIVINLNGIAHTMKPLANDTLVGLDRAFKNVKYKFVQARSKYCDYQKKVDISLSKGIVETTTEKIYENSIRNTENLRYLKQDSENNYIGYNTGIEKHIKKTSECTEKILTRIDKNSLKSSKGKLEKCCNNENDAIACYHLAFLNEGQQNNAIAVKNYEKACNMNHSHACFSYGRFLLKVGYKKRALEMFFKSCDLGYSEACAKVSSQKLHSSVK